MDTVPFQHLVTSANCPTRDSRHDAYVLLLERQPKTEAEATLLLSGLHHRTEWSARQYRKKNMQLNFDPPATQFDPCDGPMVAALDSLPLDEKELIEAHVLDGYTFRDLAERYGMSKTLVHKRYNQAIEKLRKLAEKVDKTPPPTPYS